MAMRTHQLQYVTAPGLQRIFLPDFKTHFAGGDRGPPASGGLRRHTCDGRPFRTQSAAVHFPSSLQRTASIEFCTS